MHPAAHLLEPRRRPARADVVLTSVFLGWALLEAAFQNQGGALWARLLAGAGYALPLLWRRSAPLAALAAVAAVAIARAFTADVADTGAMPFPSLLVCAFSVGIHVERRWRSLAGVVLPIATVLVVSTSPMWDGVRHTGDYAILIFFVGSAWLAGFLIRRRALQANAAERSAGERAQVAVREERARIARELHDIVAHSVSVIALQSGAAEALVERDPAAARTHMAAVRTTAHDALGELRRLLDVLRENEASYTPQPQLASIHELVATARETGQDVDFEEHGRLAEVPAGLALSAYRIVQEALTNVRKHAGPVPTRVRVASDGTELHVEVVNAAGARAAAPNGDGHGLIGIRERVRLYGGSVRAEPQTDGGFAVVATLPLQEPSA